ncbi:hypothetical protein QQS21_000750 [Conoideocrella luteorostrata]|uniref:SnoaL-like domain-containing protein n=1 Tax=Conoideocrella luteorostrata TaxID=1105319 RepID=A0AAJ0D0L9_9HYPO|nr:hypothetical protein QQS21_000750 [Conoideocrella luteorostrata]
MCDQSPYHTQETWSKTLNQLMNGPDSDVPQLLSRLYSQDCAINTNGKKLDGRTVVPYIMGLREMFASTEIRSLHWLRDRDMFAERHDVIAKLKDGTVSRIEVLIMGELNSQGQAIWLEEIAHM